jgi:hypothetical protein
LLKVWKTLVSKYLGCLAAPTVKASVQNLPSALLPGNVDRYRSFDSQAIVVGSVKSSIQDGGSTKAEILHPFLLYQIRVVKPYRC